MISMFKNIFLFCQIVSDLDVENLQKLKHSTFKETEAKEAEKLKKSRCDIL